MTGEERSLWTAPKPSEMQRLTATVELFRHLDALGIDPDDLMPTSLVGLDLRPTTFSAGSFKVDRLGPSRYLAKNAWEKTEIIADSEQQAGEQLLQFWPHWTGTYRQALYRWLRLWGWTPPPPAV